MCRINLYIQEETLGNYEKTGSYFNHLIAYGFITYAQSFSAIYSVKKTTFKAGTLSEQDAKDGLFNIVYAKGDKKGTMASLSMIKEKTTNRYERDKYDHTY